MHLSRLQEEESALAREKDALATLTETAEEKAARALSETRRKETVLETTLAAAQRDAAAVKELRAHEEGQLREREAECARLEKRCRRVEP